MSEPRSVNLSGTGPPETILDAEPEDALAALADRTGGSAQTIERAQEAAVLLVCPAHVAGPAPTVGPQPVEPTVVPGAERGVRLDVVARQLAKTRPRVEEAGPSRDNGGDRVEARATESGLDFHRCA